MGVGVDASAVRAGAGHKDEAVVAAVNKFGHSVVADKAAVGGDGEVVFNRGDGVSLTWFRRNKFLLHHSRYFVADSPVQ